MVVLTYVVDFKLYLFKESMTLSKEKTYPTANNFEIFSCRN